MYWGLRSRVNWLRWGDKNTKFFHATTIQRRQCNRILMLKKIGEEIWIKNPKILKKMTSDFFENLYHSAGPRNFHPVLQQCPSLVINKMNAYLTSEVTLSKIEKAIFEMGSEKAFGPDGCF